MFRGYLFPFLPSSIYCLFPFIAMFVFRSLEYISIFNRVKLLSSLIYFYLDLTKIKKKHRWSRVSTLHSSGLTRKNVNADCTFIHFKKAISMHLFSCYGHILFLWAMLDTDISMRQYRYGDMLFFGEVLDTDTRVSPLPGPKREPG